MVKRNCLNCEKSITRRHGKATYCKKCVYERRLAKSRAWWRSNDYSAVIAERRKAKKNSILTKTESRVKLQ